MLLLNDFINKRPLEVAHTNMPVVAEYLGNQIKFYHPKEFTSYHQVYECINWMKTNAIHLKAGTYVYPIDHIVMPEDYEHGSRSEFYHIFTGLAFLAKLRKVKKTITKEDILAEIPTLSSRTVEFGSKKLLQLDVNVNPSTLSIITNPLFRPLLKEELWYAAHFINKKIVTENMLNLLMQDSFLLKLVIGKNRGVAVNDIKLFESVNGNHREIYVDHRNSKLRTARILSN